MASAESLFFTPKEVAQKLNVSPATVRRLAQSGQLVAKRVGGQWRFPKEQTLQWLQQHSPSGADKPDLPPTRSLLELEGLGAEIWESVDAQEYVNELRKEWDHRP